MSLDPVKPKLVAKSSMFEKFMPVLVLISVVLAFFVGALWQKVELLEKGLISGSGKTADSAKQGSNNQPSNPSPNGKLSADQASKLEKVKDTDHIRGSKDAQVILIEYSDFQCPFCKQFHPTAEQALSEYSGKFAWVYRHFPLVTIHPRATPAANASECVAHLAGEDAFWKFADYVFSNQETALTDDGLLKAAKQAGANPTDFSSCFSAKKYQNIIDADAQGGSSAGVNGTPGNYLINKKGDVWFIPGAVPYPSFKASIDEALK